MTTLYNCHADGDQYRITKFDSLGEVESSYLCTVDECECPAGHRPSCRHRHMLPRFIAKEAVNTFWFYDYDRQGWVMNEPAEPANYGPEPTANQQAMDEFEALAPEGPASSDEPAPLRRRI